MKKRCTGCIDVVFCDMGPQALNRKICPCINCLVKSICTSVCPAFKKYTEEYFGTTDYHLLNYLTGRNKEGS